MTNFSWPEFGILFAASLIGDLAVMPYALQMIKVSVQRTGKPLKMTTPMLVLVSFLQTAVLLAVAITIGLLAAHAIGLGAPYIEAAIGGSIAGNKAIPPVASMLSLAIAIGIVGGIVFLALDLLLLPHFPEPLLELSRKTSLLNNFVASFYGGIAEEIFMRLFGFSVLAWLLSRIWHTSAGLPTDAGFWIVNILMALLFGLGHLPSLKAVVGQITPIMFARSILLNGIGGLVFGWLFWQYGLEAAMIAHFTLDVVYHCGGTLVLHLNDQHHFIKTQTSA